MELEEIDFKILSELEEDSKQSLKELSRKLGVPMSTIHDKVKRFERNGVILKYSAVIDAAKVGKPTLAFILVAMRYQFAGEPIVKQREVANKIAKLPLVQEIHIISGEWDILLKVRGRDLKQIGDFVIERLREIRGVDRTLSLVAFENIKETPAVPLVE
ncbi:MAG: Lrp/AsnC family transcriptional regulator [Candidatus Micrarchaeota archaeon]|nr:Lrp/AsnC family transcriptional regulator [Candidatus Micrarchaeota archaeon]